MVAGLRPGRALDAPVDRRVALLAALGIREIHEAAPLLRAGLYLWIVAGSVRDAAEKHEPVASMQTPNTTDWGARAAISGPSGRTRDRSILQVSYPNVLATILQCRNT